MILAAITLAFAQPIDIDVGRFINAISEVESGGNDAARNKQSGARGRYQIKEIVWRQHMKGASFNCAHIRKTATYVATLHVNWLIEQLRFGKEHPTVYLIALAWTSGLNRTLIGNPTKQQRDFAQRVANIYNEK